MEKTDNFLRLKPNILTISYVNKPKIPNLSCVPKRPYRIFITFETNNTEKTGHTEAFLCLKPKIPMISHLRYQRFQFCFKSNDCSRLMHIAKAN